MIVGDAANFLLGGIPGDLHDMFTFDVEPGDLAKASRTFTEMSTSVRDIHVRLSGSVASLEGRWEGSGAAAFDTEIWQPLSHGLGTLERECETAATKMMELAGQAEAAQLQKVEALNQEIQTQLWIFGATSVIGAPELGGIISEAVGRVAARLGGELVGRIVSGIVDAIATAIQKVLSALGKLLEWGARGVPFRLGEIRDAVTRIFVPTPSSISSRSGPGQALGGWAGTNMSPEESFAFHFEKHAAGLSEGQYDTAAQAWAKSPKGPGTPVQLRDGSWGIRYRTPGGGPGGILDSNGSIVTFWTR